MPSEIPKEIDYEELIKRLFTHGRLHDLPSTVDKDIHVAAEAIKCLLEERDVARHAYIVAACSKNYPHDCVKVSVLHVAAVEEYGEAWANKEFPVG